MTTNITEQKKQWALQSRLYDLAKRKGLRLEKYRKLTPIDPDYKTFRILNRTSGQVVHAARPGGYGLTLQQVEEYLNRQPATTGGTKAQAVKPTADLKQETEGKAAAEAQGASTAPGTGASTPLTQPEGGAFITIADLKIPMHVKGIYEAITAWVETKRAHQDKAVTEREKQLLGRYLDAYRAVCDYTHDQKSIYMFAHLLGAAKQLGEA